MLPSIRQSATALERDSLARADFPKRDAENRVHLDTVLGGHSLSSIRNGGEGLGEEAPIGLVGC